MAMPARNTPWSLIWSIIALLPGAGTVTLPAVAICGALKDKLAAIIAPTAVRRVTEVHLIDRVFIVSSLGGRFGVFVVCPKLCALRL